MSEEQRVVVVRDEQQQTGRNQAQMHNIRAAKAVADTVRSTLGPAGMDKMMVDGHGNVIVTNDGATILRELDVAHPGAKMIIEMAKTQENVCYDGTTSTVVLGGQLLANSEQLFQKGLHPNVICRGYHQASKWAIEYCDDLDSGSADLNLVAKTAMTGKSVEHCIDKASELCVNAVLDAEGDASKVRVVCQSGGSMDESKLFPGIVLNKEFQVPLPNGSAPNAILINTGLNTPKMEEKTNVHFSSAREAKEYNEAGKIALFANAEKVASILPHGGVVFSRDGVDERVVKFLAEANIAVVRRVTESSLTSLSRLLSIGVAHDIESLGEQHVGECLSIREDKIGDMKYVIIEHADEQCPVSTLILRGATMQTLDEFERAFADSVGVVSLAFRDGKLVTGGGSVYISMANHLRQRAADMGGREQMAVEAFAEALEIIPATIAENAGHDPLDTILALRNDHAQGMSDRGVDVTNGGTASMTEIGVIEPLSVITQAIRSSSEVAISILRIDDIISKRME